MTLRCAGWLCLAFVVLAGPALAQGVGGLGDDELADARAAMQEQQWARATRLLSAVIRQTPDHLEARYLRGICYGERGKHPTAERYLGAFLVKGAEDFAVILERDSLYRDVLYQFALLRRYDGDYAEAIRLGHAQIRLKPDLAHAQVGLGRIYWRFLIDTDRDKARHWLNTQQTAYATLFKAELYRREGWYRRADDTLAGLLERPSQLSKTAVLLARARTHFAWGRPESAHRFMEQAVGAVQAQADALFLFDDVKYIVSSAELSAFNQIEEPAAYRQFFETFWARRDPMPAAPVNPRMTEHYRRLRVAEADYVFYGFRAWYNSPYAYNAQHFPPTFALGSDFDDRGIIYIRHGEPDDYVIGGATGQVAGSWLYDDPLLVFHFVETQGGGSGIGRMVFTPTPQGRTFAGGRIVGIDPLDAERKSSSYIVEGLTTDRHRWPERLTRMAMPYLTAAFRGEDGHTLVEVHYAVPVDAVARAVKPRADSLALEVGLALHDRAWRRVGFFREMMPLPPVADRAAHAFGRFQIDVPPDSYRVALHGRALHAPLLAAHTFGYRVPSFRGAGLKMSDLLLADAVLELSETQVRSRDEVYVQVNPLGRFSTRRPVFVYVEVYNLARSPGGQTRYRMTYTLVPRKPGDRGSISLTASDVQGTETAPIEYVGIDVSDVPPGAYILAVQVRDALTGATVERTRPIDLYHD